MSTEPGSRQASATGRAESRLKKRLWVAVISLVAAAACLIGVRDSFLARATLLVAITVILWLTEVVPAYAVTLALIAGIPLVLGPERPDFGIRPVLAWAADPVMALFFGGFSLAAAASRHGIDEYVAGRALALSRGRRRRLLGLIMASTAILSMWMSNIAAAAMMLAALSPHLDRAERTEPFRRALLLGVAMAANLGGMATPIGTGPNGIAIAQLAPWAEITFVQWMAFALPLTLGMVLAGYFLIMRIYRVEGNYKPVDIQKTELHGRSRGLVVIFLLAVTAWLAEPVHGISAPIVAIATAAVLFGGGWLRREDLGLIDWATLFLIAGGLVIGQIVERAGLVHAATAGIRWEEIPILARVLGLVLAAAVMSAFMSNTASAAILIPLGLSLGPPHSIAVLIAIGTAFGMPFVISTPPNAMVYGRGGLHPRHLIEVGLPIMIAGCLIVGLTGPALLSWIGLP